MPEQTDHADARRQALEERVLLLAPSFGYWAGRYMLPKGKTDIKVSGASIDNDDVTTPQSKLMTDTVPVDSEGRAWKKRFRELATRQQRLIDRYSVPFPIRGVRIVPRTVGLQFGRELREIRDELEQATNEFVNDLAGILRQIQSHTRPEVWNAVVHKIPRDPDKMREKFYVDSVQIELAGGRSRETGVEELEDEVNMAREATRRKIDEAIESMIAGPRQELAEALAGLQDVISRDGRVSTKSFNPVHDAIRKIRAFDFAADANLMSQIEALETRMGNIVPSTLDAVTSASTGFSKALRSVLDEVADAERTSAAIEEFGKPLRGLQI